MTSTTVRRISLCHRLLLLYIRTSGWVALAMLVLWWVGVEGIYYHVTPLYALYLPVFSRPWLTLVLFALVALGTRLWVRWYAPEAVYPHWRRLGLVAAAVAGLVAYSGWLHHAPPDAITLELFRHLVAFAVVGIGLSALAWALRRWEWPGQEPTPAQMRRVLLALVVFAFVFPGAIAMVRSGVDGLAQAYAQGHRTEYIYDIGGGGSIRGLFRDYLKIHPHLNLHSKAHPPGPIAFLWIWSYLVGRSPLALSLATMATASLAVIPLYHWVADMLGRKTALTTVAIYVVMPSIVLFTATSADILFLTLAITTLFLFWRALHRNSVAYQIGAGAAYGICSLTSFTLLSLGAFFAFMGFLRLGDRHLRRAVLQTAFIMIATFVGVHYVVWRWSGFDVIGCFQLCLAQFQHDQLSLDMLEPRYPGWVYRFLNPFTFFIYAGIAVSLLFIGRYLRRDSRQMPIMWVLLATAFALNMLYMGRGEGERSALYIFPFLAIPAASYLQELQEQAQSSRPLLLTAACLAFQCWVMESLLYTYW